MIFNNLNLCGENATSLIAMDTAVGLIAQFTKTECEDDTHPHQ